MEMEGVESSLGQISIEKEKCLVRDRDGVDVMEAEMEGI